HAMAHRRRTDPKPFGRGAARSRVPWCSSFPSTAVCREFTRTHSGVVADDPFLTSVDHEPAPAQEPDERQTVIPREANGQTGGGRHRCDDRHAGDERLLHDLETTTPAHE